MSPSVGESIRAEKPIVVADPSRAGDWFCWIDPRADARLVGDCGVAGEGGLANDETEGTGSAQPMASVNATTNLEKATAVRIAGDSPVGAGLVESYLHWVGTGKCYGQREWDRCARHLAGVIQPARLMAVPS
jgi:hypothetical protein